MFSMTFIHLTENGNQKIDKSFDFIASFFDMDISGFYNFGSWPWMFGPEVPKIQSILKDMNASKYGNMNYPIRACF